MITFLKGDMWASAAQIRVNTVNCVGVMGKGVALEFKKRYPAMYAGYKEACAAGKVIPGTMHIYLNYKAPLPAMPDHIINFPTKRHWRDDSRYEDIEAGLDALRTYLLTQPEQTVTIPALGCGNGGLDWNRIKPMVAAALSGLPQRVLIFEPVDAAPPEAGPRLSDWR